MVPKEQPEFFNSTAEYFVIEVTDEMRSRAKEMQSQSNETDTTDSRSNRRSKQDSLVGKLGEIVVEKFFTLNDISASFNSGWGYDMEIDGYTAEIKTRDYTQTHPNYYDLLVRDRMDTQWTPSDVDIVIQVMLNGDDSSKGYITGYAYGNFVESCGFFQKAKTHRTREVPHSELQPIEDLL